MRQIEQLKKRQMPVQQKPMAQPMRNSQVMPGKPIEKKSKLWLWIIIALVGLIGIAAIVYFVFIK